jgi:hypothetical protein
MPHFIYVVLTRIAGGPTFSIQLLRDRLHDAKAWHKEQ